MHSLLDSLVALGDWALPSLWIPILAWTVAALVVEAGLRLRPGPHALVGLGARRAMLWALPGGVLAALVIPGLLPNATVEQVFAIRPGAFALPAVEIAVAPGAAEFSASPSLPLVPLVAGLAVIAGGVFSLARVAGVLLGLAKLRRLSVGASDAEVQRETDRAAQAAGVERSIRAVSTGVPIVPFTYGWRRPVVVLPSGLGADPDALRLVLAHEVAHIARGDFAASVMERIASGLFGWHPLVGVLSRQIDLDRERATDAAVLAQHPGKRRDYASLLLSFSRLPSPALALGVAQGSRSLTSRITTMNASPLSSRRLRQLGVTARLLGAALFLLAVGGATLVAVGSSQNRVMAATSVQEIQAESSSGLAEAPGDLAAPAPLADATQPPADQPEPTPTADRQPESPESGPAEAAALTIEGRVLDDKTGEPLVGASVVVDGTRKGAATDTDGRFAFTDVVAGDIRLTAVHMGYFPQTLTPRAGEAVTFRLQQETEEMRTRRREMMERARQRADEARTIDPDGPEAPEVYEVVEQAPRLVGGIAGLQQSLVYPAEAQEAGEEGKVFIQFVVDEQGSVQDARCVRTPAESLCAAALTAVQAATFEPGRQRGKPVKVRFTLPVDFKLAREDE